MQSTSLTQAAGCLGAAGLISTWAAMQSRWLRGVATSVRSWGLVAAGAAVVSGPAVLSIISDRHINGENATLAFALTPVVVAVALSAFGEVMSEDLVGRLWPGLAGIAGLLLLLPQPAVSDWRLDLALLAMPLVAGLSASSITARLALGRENNSKPPWFSWNSAALALAGLAFAALASRSKKEGVLFPFSCGAAVLDGLTSFLTLSAFGKLGAVRWSAQFLIIPLITLLEGVVLLRPVLDARSWGAFVLLTLSSGYLLITGSNQTAAREPAPGGP